MTTEMSLSALKETEVTVNVSADKNLKCSQWNKCETSFVLVEMYNYSWLQVSLA